MASLASSLGSEVIFQTELRFPEGRATYSVVVGADVSMKDPAVRDRAIARMEAAQIRPTKEQTQQWLATLQISCAGGRKSQLEDTFQLEVYAVELGRYPADVAREACKLLARRGRGTTNWFPTLAEMLAECDRLSAPRKVILAALQNWREAAPDERRSAAVRDRLLKAKQMEDDSYLLKRSNPDRYAELVADAKSLRSEADMLRRGELEP